MKKTSMATVLTLSLAAFASVTHAGKVPDQLADTWTVDYVSQPPSLGLAVGDKVRIGSEFWGHEQFDLNVELVKGSEHARQLGEPTLFLSRDPQGKDNVLTETEAQELRNNLGFKFLELFDQLVEKKTVRTYVIGVGYLRHEKSEHDAQPADEPHVIVSLSYKTDPKELKPQYLLAIIALGQRPNLPMHNGVIHGKP